MTERDLTPENTGLINGDLDLKRELFDLGLEKPVVFDDSSVEAVDFLVARSTGVDTAKEIEGIRQDISHEADSFYKELPVLSQEIIPKKIEPKKTLLEKLTGAKTVRRAKAWAAAVIAAFSLSPIAAGASSDIETDPSEAVVTSGEMPSQSVELSANEVTPGPSEGVFTLEQVRDSIVNGPEATPMPTAKVEVARDAVEAWQQRTFGPIEAELRAIEGTQEERIKVDARAIYCLRNSEQFGALKVQDYINEEEIIAHCKGEENDKVICDEEGNSMTWMVIADKKIEKNATKGMAEALKWYKVNGMPDMLESAVENGLGIFFVANTHSDRGPDSVWLNGSGLICLNQGSENVGKIKSNNAWRNQYIRALFVEPYGIKFFQVVEALGLFDESMGSWKNVGNCEVVKSLVAGYVAEALRGKDKDERYALYADSYPSKAINFAGDYADYGVTVDGPQTRNLLALMADFVRIPGFGSLWDVPTYQSTLTVASR